MIRPTFFTAVSYHKARNIPLKTKALKKVDNYFFLSGKKAYITPVTTTKGRQVVLSDSRSSGLAKAAKVLSYCTIVIPVTLLGAKVVLRLMHSFVVLDSKRELERGLNISPATFRKLRELWPQISNITEHDEIEYLPGGRFILKCEPNIIFDQSPLPGRHFDNRVKAQAVCMAHRLDLLVIPKTKLVSVGTPLFLSLLAEERLNIDYEVSMQKHHYRFYSKDLDESVMQLATFIAKTGFSNMTWRNVPVINEEEGFQGERRFALLNLDQMQSPVQGFIGNSNTVGLIGCVEKDQIDPVIRQARKKGVSLSKSKARNAKTERLAVINAGETLVDFHQRKGIVTGKEPLIVDVDALGLDLTETEKILKMKVDLTDNSIKHVLTPITLREAVEDVIQEINRIIQESNDQGSIQEKRYILLSTNKDPFQKYHNFGVQGKLFVSPEEEKQLWLNKIIQALIDNEHIYQLRGTTGVGYYIQA